MRGGEGAARAQGDSRAQLLEIELEKLREGSAMNPARPQLGCFFSLVHCAPGCAVSGESVMRGTPREFYCGAASPGAIERRPLMDPGGWWGFRRAPGAPLIGVSHRIDDDSTFLTEYFTYLLTYLLT